MNSLFLQKGTKGKGNRGKRERGKKRKREKREKEVLLVLLARFVLRFNTLNNCYLKAQNKQKKPTTKLSQICKNLWKSCSVEDGLEKTGTVAFYKKSSQTKPQLVSWESRP